MHASFHRLASKFRYLLRGRAIDHDLARELDFHTEMLAEDQRRLGFDEGAAILIARRKMGNTTLMTEYSRDAWLIAWLDNLVRDLRYALRAFARNPGFTLVATVTLALGIGANAAIFQLVDTVLLRTLPVEQPGELLTVRSPLSYWRYEQLRDRNEVFSGVLAARALTSVTATLDGQSIGHPTTELVSGNYFSLLGVQPVIGRAIAPDDDRGVGGGPVAVISHAFWQRAFAGSPGYLAARCGCTAAPWAAAPADSSPTLRAYLARRRSSADHHRCCATAVLRRDRRQSRGRLGADHDAAAPDSRARVDHAPDGFLGLRDGPAEALRRS